MAHGSKSSGNKQREDLVVPDAQPKDLSGGPWTIDAWCQRWNFSRAYFHKMQREGTGPDVFRKDGIVRITPRADLAFQNRYENPESEDHQRSKRVRQEHARKAATRAVASPNHVAKRRHPGRRVRA